MNRSRPIIIAGLLMLAIGGVDYFTGSEIGLSVFYFAPVGLLAWHCKSRLPALLMAASCAVLWYVSDDLGGRVYSSASIGLWNAGLRLSSFTVIALLVSAVRASRNRQDEMNALLCAALDDLQTSTERITELQSQMQTVCAWTNRIRSEGKWMTFEEFMERHFQLQFTHGISKEAYESLSATASRPAA